MIIKMMIQVIKKILILLSKYYKIQKNGVAKDVHWEPRDSSHLLKQLNLSQGINDIAENAEKLGIIKKIAR